MATTEQGEKPYSEICHEVASVLALHGCPAPHAMAPAVLRVIYQHLAGGAITAEAIERSLTPPDIQF